jgi:hypothetical protein
VFRKGNFSSLGKRFELKQAVETSWIKSIAHMVSLMQHVAQMRSSSGGLSVNSLHFVSSSYRAPMQFLLIQRKGKIPARSPSDRPGDRWK